MTAEYKVACDIVNFIATACRCDPDNFEQSLELIKKLSVNFPLGLTALTRHYIHPIIVTGGGKRQIDKKTSTAPTNKRLKSITVRMKKKR